MKDLTETINNLIVDLTSNLDALNDITLQKTDELVQSLCKYNNSYSVNDLNKNAEKYYIPDYYNLFLSERNNRGYKNYDKIKLSENSIGLYRLKRHISFKNSGSLVGADKGVILELVKRRENSYEVHLLNYTYAGIPTIGKYTHKTITEKQINYFCEPLNC